MRQRSNLGAVDVGDGGDQLAFVGADLEYLHHEWDGIILLEPLRHSLLEHRRRERAK